MKKLLIKILVFFIILCCCDKIIGFTSVVLVNNAKGGDYGKNNYIIREMNSDVLIIGSSRGIHHYDPTIIEDSLGLSCFNCSRDGNGIIMHYAYYKAYSSRYVPKIIIYDITPNFDLIEEDDNDKYLEWSRPYYDIEGVDSVFWDVDKTERIKMLSSCYQYNSKHLQIISDLIHPSQNDIKGYRPIDKKMEYDISEKKAKHIEYRYDSLKLKYIKRLIEDCQEKGTKIILYTSPSYKAKNTNVFIPIKEIAKEYKIPYFEHYNDTAFVTNKDFFYDSVHMNRKGATKYTQSIIAEIRTYISRY